MVFSGLRGGKLFSVKGVIQFGDSPPFVDSVYKLPPTKPNYWARKGKEVTGLVNILSAKINQWTLLIAMIPLTFGVVSFTNSGLFDEVVFTQLQKVEVLLTISQALFACICFIKLRFVLWEAVALISLWIAQLPDEQASKYLIDILPSLFGTEYLLCEYFSLLYLSLAVFDLILYRKEINIFQDFADVVKQHVLTTEKNLKSP